MDSRTRFLLLSAIVFAGCHTTEKVAVSTFHVIDAPAKYVRDHIDHTETTTTTTTTTAGVSDVTTPGRPVNAPPPKVVSHETSTGRGATSTTSATTPKSSTPTTATKEQFPTAKPVPGKPGYVYSVDAKGGIVDVTGYKSGDKAKDPYSKQIFIVP
ncbi:MAG: hypothetical protein ACXWBS_07100 [Chthoniobacterales bacterium]